MTSPHEAPGAGSGSHRSQERMQPEPSLGCARAGSGSRSRSRVPGRRAPSGRASAAQLCTRQGRSPELGGGRGGASTHQPRTSASWSGSSGPWRRPRPAAAAAAATVPGPPTATAPHTGAPRALPPCSGKLRSAPRAVSPPRRQLFAPAPTASRGHLLRPAATPPCAPLPAPPRPLPLAAPSARRGRLRAATRGRPPAKVSALSRAQAGSALHTSREQFPSTDWGTLLVLF